MYYQPVQGEDFEYPFFIYSRKDPRSIDSSKLIVDNNFAIGESYGEKLLIKLLAPVLSKVISLRFEYKTYYQEYATFEEYLYKNQLLEKSLIEQIVANEKKFGDIYLGQLKNEMSYSLSDLVSTDENTISMINSIIEELDDEN